MSLLNGVSSYPTGRTATYVIAASTGYPSDAEKAKWQSQSDEVCDGTNDQNNVMTAAIANGYTDILLSPGTFYADGSTGVTKGAIDITQSNVTIRGSGKYLTKWFLKASQPISIFNIGGTVGSPITGIKISDMELDGNLANNAYDGTEGQECSGIAAYYTSKSRFENIYSHDNRYHGLFMYNNCKGC